MKKYIFTISLILIGLLSSCNLYLMKLSHYAVDLDGNAQTFTIRANHSVQRIFIDKPRHLDDEGYNIIKYEMIFDNDNRIMYCEGEWFRVEVPIGEGDHNITIKLSENNTGEARWLEVRATYEEKDASCLITQKPLH